MEEIFSYFQNTCAVMNSFCVNHNKSLIQAWNYRRNPFEIYKMISEEERKNLQINEEKLKQIFLVIKKINLNIDNMDVWLTFARYKNTGHGLIIQKWYSSNKNIFHFLNSEYYEVVKKWAMCFIDYEEIKEKAKGETMDDLSVPSINVPNPINHFNGPIQKKEQDNSGRVRSLEELEKLF